MPFIKKSLISLKKEGINQKTCGVKPHRLDPGLTIVMYSAHNIHTLYPLGSLPTGPGSDVQCPLAAGQKCLQGFEERLVGEYILQVTITVTAMMTTKTSYKLLFTCVQFLISSISFQQWDTDDRAEHPWHTQPRPARCSVTTESVCRISHVQGDIFYINGSFRIL